MKGLVGVVGGFLVGWLTMLVIMFGGGGFVFGMGFDNAWALMDVLTVVGIITSIIVGYRVYRALAGGD